MLSLDSPEWARLTHCYGSAKDVPGMLLELSRAPNKEVWDRLWSSLCHQSDVYPATFAAIPHIVALAETLDPENQRMCWYFVGAVAQESGGNWSSRPPEEFREEYEKALARAASGIFQVLTAGVEDEGEAAGLLEALASVRGCVKPARVLSYYVDDEIPTTCPGCEVELFVVVDQDRIYLTAEEPGGHPDPDRTWVEHPVVPASLPNVRLEQVNPENHSHWVLSLAEQAGHPGLRDRFHRLYGQAQCPACGHRFPLMDHLCREDLLGP